MSYTMLRPLMRSRDGSVYKLYHAGSTAQSVIRVSRSGIELRTPDRVVATVGVLAVAGVIAWAVRPS